MPEDASGADEDACGDRIPCQDCDDAEAPICAWCWLCERCVAVPGACGDRCDFRAAAAEADRKRYEEIGARLTAAMRGPWQVESGDDLHGEGGGELYYVTDVVAMADDDPPLCSFYSRADAELVANAPDDLAFLLARNAALEARLNTMTVSRDRFEGEASELRQSWQAKHDAWLEARAEVQRLREQLAAGVTAKEAP